VNRNDPDSTSLDLLLDTITNTFGGVLFVTILVVLQLRANQVIDASLSANKSSSNSPDDLHYELKRRSDEVKMLKQVAGAQQRSIEKFLQGDAQKSYELVIGYRARLQELSNQRSRLMSTIEQENSESERLSSQLDDRRTDIEFERQRREEIEREIARQKLAHTRTAELPTLRATEKREFPVIVRFGRLYTPYEIDPFTLERSRHLDDFLPLGEEDEVVRLTPNPLRGIPLNSSENSEDMLRRLWDQFPKESFYVCGAVWDDSFSEFPAFKESLVARGIEYRLIPSAAGDIIREESADRALVQ
jgi:hypothetical protein